MLRAFLMAILLSFGLAACGCRATPSPAPKSAEAPPPKPALWQVADSDTRIYLFGTIHVLPKDFAWRTKSFVKAEQQADELVLEVADLSDEAKAASNFLRLAVSPGLPRLMERVPAEKQRELARLIVRAKVPEAALDRMESWAAALTIATGLLTELDISPDSGVERQLEKSFRARKRPVKGLETSEQQLGFFDTLPEKTQRFFLMSIIDEEADAQKEFDAMLSAWARGDEKAIALSFDDELKLSPELTDVLLYKRNRNWAEWVAKRLDKPGTVLVAVGAGHLSGRGSVIELLEKRGLKVSRIQ